MTGFDIFILVLFSVYIIRGLRQGLLKQAVGMLSYLASFVLALLGSRPVGDMIVDIFNMNMEEVIAGDETLELISDSLLSFVDIEMIAGSVAFIVLFFVLQIVAGFVIAQLKLVNSIPLLGPLNIMGAELWGF